MNDGKICHFAILFTFLCLVYLHTSTVRSALSKPDSLSFHSFRSTNTFFITELLATD